MIRRKRRCRPFSFNGRICPVSRKPGQGAGFGGCRNSLFACFYDDDKLLHLLLKGPAALTKHDSTLYLPDADGDYQSYTTDKPAWIGGRYVDEDNVYATDSSGNLLDPPPEMVSQPAAELKNTYSHDLSGWSGTATVTSCAGLHPDFNGSNVSDTSTSAAEYRLKNVIVDCTKNIIVVYYIKKETSINGSARLEHTLFGSTDEWGYISFNAVDGTYAVHYGVDDVLVKDEGSHWKVILSNLSGDTSNTHVEYQVAPVQYTTDTTTTDTSLTGDLDVLNVEVYEDKTVDQIKNSGAIFTDAATVSTDSLNPEFSSSLLDNNSFAMAFNVRPDSAGLVAGCFLGYGMGGNLIVNGNFENWTSDNPDNWTIYPEDANNYVTEDTLGCRLISDGNPMYVSQSITTVGKKYIAAINVISLTGSIKFTNGTIETALSSGYNYWTFDAESTYLSISRRLACDSIFNNIWCRELDSDTYPQFTLMDAANNSISVAGTAGEMNKVGVVFNRAEGKMKLYVDDNSAEGPYSGEFHDGILDWFRDSLFPGGLYGYKIWDNCDWDEQNENVTNWLSDLNKAFDDGFDDGFS